MRRQFFKRITFSLAFAGSMLLAASSYAEQRTAAKSSTHRKIQAKSKSAVPTPPPAPVSAPVAVNYPPPPLTALQQPPRRARVQLDDGGLLIQADNSSLVQILREVASASGMKIDGLNQDERVFGSFGPGNAQEVLIRLLEGTSYNLLMVGDTEKGTPRQMVLTSRGATRGAYAPPAPSAPRPDEEEDAAPQEEEPQPAPEPIAAPPAPANPNQQQPSVKTPQQLLEELRKMRNQEEQNNRPQE